jgi:hypothetical protein
MPPPTAPLDETSPGPPPTTASAAPDVRARQLQRLLAATLDATLAKVSHDNFAACFPTAARHKPDTLRRFHADFVTRLGEQCAVSPASSPGEEETNGKERKGRG